MRPFALIAVAIALLLLAAGSLFYAMNMPPHYNVRHILLFIGGMFTVAALSACSKAASSLMATHEAHKLELAPDDWRRR